MTCSGMIIISMMRCLDLTTSRVRDQLFLSTFHYSFWQPGSTVLSYYKGKDDFLHKGKALGEVHCLGANVFLKGVTKDMVSLVQFEE